MSMESDPAARDGERFAMLAALVNGDVPLAYRLVVELLAYGVPFDDIVTDVLGPVQQELGRRWAAGDLGIADEHAASAAVDDLLVRLGATAESPVGPAVVVASPEHDAHALGGRVIASALALEGYRVMFLGASVPAAASCGLSRTAAALRGSRELFDLDRPGRCGSLDRGGARSRDPSCGRWRARSRLPIAGPGSVSTLGQKFPPTQSGF